MEEKEKVNLLSLIYNLLFFPILFWIFVNFSILVCCLFKSQQNLFGVFLSFLTCQSSVPSGDVSAQMCVFPALVSSSFLTVSCKGHMSFYSAFESKHRNITTYPTPACLIEGPVNYLPSQSPLLVRAEYLVCPVFHLFFVPQL